MSQVINRFEKVADDTTEVIEVDETSYLEETDPDYDFNSTNISNDEYEEGESMISNSSHSSLSIFDELSSILNENKNDIPKNVTENNRSTIELVLQYHEKFDSFISKNEVPRKVFHSSMGFLALYLYSNGYDQHDLVKPMIYLFIVLLANDFFRLRNKKFNKLICSTFWFVMRSKEVNNYNGILWYLLGLIIVFTTCPKDISIMSVLLLSWSDTAASTFGRAYGYLTPKLSANKSLAGSIAAFFVGVISCYLFYGYFIPEYNYWNEPGEVFWIMESSYLNLHIFALLSGLIASVSEFIDIFGWDDNFTIPVLSGFFLYGAVALFRK